MSETQKPVQCWCGGGAYVTPYSASYDTGPSVSCCGGCGVSVRGDATRSEASAIAMWNDAQARLALTPGDDLRDHGFTCKACAKRVERHPIAGPPSDVPCWLCGETIPKEQGSGVVPEHHRLLVKAEVSVAALTDKQRIDVFCGYCTHCGRKREPDGSRKCECYLDER